MSMIKQMPVKAVADLIGEHDTRLWRVLNHYVDQARDKVDLSDVHRVGIDETSSKRGHNYISVFVDLDTPKVVYATEGKDSDTIEDFVDEMRRQEQIQLSELIKTRYIWLKTKIILKKVSEHV